MAEIRALCFEKPDIPGFEDTEKLVADYGAENNWPSFIKHLRTERREGLIRAKVFGSRKATGQVLVFLDSHCEVNQMWLEPMLSKVKENPHRLVVSVCVSEDCQSSIFFTCL